MITYDERFIEIQAILASSNVLPENCFKINNLIIELSKENARLKEQIINISNCIKYRNVSSAMQQQVLSYQIELENHYKIRYHELHNNWNKLKEYMINAEQIYKESDDEYVKDMHEIGIRHAYKTILCKIQELEKGRDE